MSFNQPTFLGVRKVTKATDKTGVDQIVMSWTISSATAQAGIPNLPPYIPLQQIQAGVPAGYFWYGWQLDPISQQGQYNFGESRTMMVNISRLAATMSAAVVYVPGRVVIFCPDTQQVVTYGPNHNFVVLPTGLAFTDPLLFDSDNDVVPIRLKQSSKLEVWVETDVESPTGGPPAQNGMQSIVNITLCNFDVAPVSVR